MLHTLYYVWHVWYVLHVWQVLLMAVAAVKVMMVRVPTAQPTEFPIELMTGQVVPPTTFTARIAAELDEVP
jgi:hypothetical protein